MSNEADDGAGLLRSLFARSRARGVPRAAPRPPPTPKPEPTPSGPVDPLWGLLDERDERAWEATLNARELETWEALKRAIAEASPDMRWRAAGYAVRMELEYARRQLRIARNVAREGFKADLIARNGVALREAVERLEERLTGLYEFVRPMDALLVGAEEAWAAVELCQASLGRVVSPWRGTAPGAERGDGVPGYDTPENVERRREQVREAYARHLARTNGRDDREPEVKAKPAHRGRRGPNPNQPGLIKPEG